MQATGYGAYQRIQAETSSPAELITLLYNGLLTDLQRASAGLAAGDYETVNARLMRAQEIVLELLASLDRSQGEIPAQLAALYDYAYQRLLHANVQKDAAAVRDVIDVIQPLAEAWIVAAQTAEASTEQRGGRP